MHAQVVLCKQTHSGHNSKDIHVHPNLLGLFLATAEKYIMIITVWVYIPELTRSDSDTHTIQKCQGLRWCVLTGVQLWNSWMLGSGLSTIVLHYTSWEPSQHQWKRCRSNKTSRECKKWSPYLEICVNVTLRKSRWECVKVKLCKLWKIKAQEHTDT